MWGACSIEGAQVHIPNGAQPAGGTDAHLGVVDQTNGNEYDMWQAQRTAVDGGELDARLERLLDDLHSAGPQAQAHCKRLLAALRGRDPFDPQVAEQTARSIAEVRAGAEAREGIAAFFAKRKAGWI